MSFNPIILALSLLVFTACGSGTKHGETSPLVKNADFTDTFVYDGLSKYKMILVDCVSATRESNSCTLETLPFLSQEKTVPTKAMIMQRVVTSHAWMGERFSQMLDVLDDDIKMLLGAVTSIVIDDDIIPSYYWSLTGAMYIDPRYLWLTPEEASTITKKEDYRASFGNKLQFLETRRNLLNGKYATKYFSMENNDTRTLDDIEVNLASLLYHELAHANDYFPPYLRGEVDSSDTVLSALNSIFSKNITNKLYETYPLTSMSLSNMGQVMYKGEDATEEQKQVTAIDMGDLFENDNAVTMYAYSSGFEDTATLFQNAMMKLHYNIEQDFAFLEKPIKTENLKCADYIVGWGQRNIIANEDVKRRALFVTKKILPNIKDLDTLFETKLGKVQNLPVQIDWCSAMDLNPSTNKQFKLQNQAINPDDFKLLSL